MNERWTSDCIEKIHPDFIEEAGTFPPDKPKSCYGKIILIVCSVVFVGIALLLFFLPVTPPREYRIEKDNGQYLLYLDPQYAREFDRDTMFTQIYLPIYRDSVKEVEQAFRHGNFTSTEFYNIGRYANADGIVPIFDLDNLIEPVFPDRLYYKVEFTPNYYLLKAEDKTTGTTISMRDIPQDRFTDFTGIVAFHETVRIPADAADAQDQLQHAYRNTGYETSEICYYIIEGTCLTYYVMEYYDTIDSEIILMGIEIYAEPSVPDGHYLLIQIHGPMERPEVVWLAQFGYQPYQP